MRKVTREDTIMMFILNEFHRSPTNEISIYKSDIKSLKISEQEIVRSLFVLSEDGIVTIKLKSQHNDFSIPWKLRLTSAGVHYFENKHEKKIEKRNKWIQFWIPVSISIAALIIAIIAL